MKIHPKVVGEFDDNALLLVFGQAGEGVFMVLTVFETEVKQQYQVQIIGRTDKIRERFHAISVEQIIRHPAAFAISESVQQELFFDHQ